MPTTNRDPRGDNRTKPKGGTGRYGRATATGSVGSSLLLPTDNTEGVVATINSVLAAGDAIMFSRTTNGSVVCLTLYSGNNMEKLYGKTTEELEDLLAAIENTAAEAARGERP